MLAAAPTACAAASLLRLVALVGVGASSSRVSTHANPFRPLVRDPVVALVGEPARAIGTEVCGLVLNPPVEGIAVLLGAGGVFAIPLLGRMRVGVGQLPAVDTKLFAFG